MLSVRIDFDMYTSQFVTSKICLECKGCCKFFGMASSWVPKATSEDIKKIKEKGVPLADFLDGKTLKPSYVREAEIFICKFLNFTSSKCTIYDIRPFMCRLYPFILNHKGKKVFLAADPFCPYIKKKIKSKAFKQHVKQLYELLSSPQMKTLIKKNPHIIGEYKEAINLADLPAK